MDANVNTSAATFEPVPDSVFHLAFERVFAHRGAGENDARVDLKIVQSPVGSLMLSATRSALHGLEFVDTTSLESRLRSLRRRSGASVGLEPSELLERTHRQLDEYFSGRRTSFDVPLSYEGTDFQQKVWSALLKIGYGRTWSYLELAESIGDRSATRAVGMANGANPLAIVIPCHRVVNANGALGGYGGGLWRKRVLLDLEKGQAQLPL